MRWFPLLLTSLLSTVVLSAQGQSQYIPNIIPPSPNASTLLKFADVPVSPYTGTASATVPIYTIQAKGVTVPVSLDYHTGGIKLKEEAGWVGLGWALTAGGVISKTIMDEDDFGGNKTYFTPVVPQMAGDISSTQNEGFKNPLYQTGPYFREFACNYLVNTTAGLQDYYRPLSFYPSPYDLEPDIYHYSFLNKSGSFMITRDRKIVLQKQDNIKIDFENNGNSFTITDEHGNQFLFSDKEYSMSATGALSTLSLSAWYLSKITTAQKDEIVFHYYNDNTMTSVRPEYYDKKRTYDYNYYIGAGKYSYGKLMSPPSYSRYVSVQNGEGGTCNTLTLMGSSQTAMTSIVQGNIVGYDQVTEYVVDPRNNSNNGKTVYSYFNSPDTTLYYYGFRFPGIPNIGNHLNGSLLSMKVFGGTSTGYQPVSENYNYFHTVNRSIYFSLKTQTPPGGATKVSESSCLADTSTPYNILGCLYPSIKSDRLLMDSTKEIIYDLHDPAKTITQVKRFYYDNTNHYMVTRMVSADSKLNRNTSFIKYPQDYLASGSTSTGNTVIDGLISRNMVAEVIEKRDSLFYSGASSGSITGAQLSNYKVLPSNAMALDAQQQLNIPSPVTNFQPFALNGNATSQDNRYEKMIIFNRYDDANNIIQFMPVSQGPVSMLWDYGKHFPTVEVKNAQVDDIAATSFEAEAWGGCR